MNIFNSLGSNYDFSFAIRALLYGNNPGDTTKLKSYLEEKYQGKATLLYKGREAIELALNLLNFSKGTLVGINGFTCYAVYKAVINAGYKVEYLDIKSSDLNFSPQELQSTLKKNPDIKIVIVQNTLGYPCVIERIAAICKENKIVLIEDLAHSIGTIYKNGQVAGMSGDFVVLSFSQDKIVDGVSGGALIVRNKKYLISDYPPLDQVPSKQQIIDRLYPLLTYLIRFLYPVSLGKIIHYLFKKLGLLSNPMGNQDTPRLQELPSWYCSIIYTRFKLLSDDLSHRRKIASIYVQKINQKVLSESIIKQVPISTNLRFPIFVKDRESLVKYLQTEGIYVSDIWYDAPIAPKKYMNLTDYHNQCPEAEKISSQILNLPTHKNISVEQAVEIAERINQWLK